MRVENNEKRVKGKRSSEKMALGTQGDLVNNQELEDEVF